MRSTPSLLLTLGFMASFALGACGGDDKPPLEGTRIPLFTNTNAANDAPAVDAPGGIDAQSTLPEAWSNNFWPQGGGFANHSMGQLTLPAKIGKAWTVSFGEGSKDESPLTASPIAADGRLYALDSDAHVTAIDAASGKEVWSVSVLPPSEDEAVLGGGVAYAGGKVFVTAGFREIWALNPADGKMLWRTKLPNAARSAPTALPDQVYVTTVDNKTVAIATGTGKIAWVHQGFAAGTGMLGASSPAATPELVAPVYSSGEVYVLNPLNGNVLWTDTLASMVRRGVDDSTTDIKALPVLEGSTVLATTAAGTIGAYDTVSGARKWTAQLGGTETPWVAGNRIYAIGKGGVLSAISFDTGEKVWSQPLQLKDADGHDQNWFGPVFAGGRIIVTSSQGYVGEFDPRTGKALNAYKIDVKPYTAPIIANGAMYFAGSDGTLTAWK